MSITPEYLHKLASDQSVQEALRAAADAIRQLRANRAEAVDHERNVIAEQARIYAGHYPEASDGRNTFILLAEWIERRGDQQSTTVPK